ncbi:Xanthine/uracil/vitamin C permease [Halothece sp. PCC 7418]|uniref:NCS2 family permease n=1 Tax=Halothece sp. (strain PCC 7418) TaxID=65093 RepID=UPI0002A0678E|nr:NCS2 family permease [Halothece sp. PCC 7418]AFZ43172.1 Xanthine/uracil/vitamin C permease [Halothece sp. PCC 7418]
MTEEEQPSGMERYFQFQQLQTNFKTELVAGFTTFMTMAYILAANPGILSNAIFLEESGDLFNELAIATAISAAIATFVMGIYARFPFALAPGMGLNAYFAFSVVLGEGISWQTALAAVLMEGMVFVLLTITNIRRLVVAAIPQCLKAATTAGIGGFIAYIALQSSGIIANSDTTLTTLGNLASPKTGIAIIGLFLTAALTARRIKGGLLWGILGTAMLAWIAGIAPWPRAIIGFPSLPSHLFGQAWVGLTQISPAATGELLTVLFVFLFVDFFDTVGTVTGLGMRTGYIQENGEFPGVNRALLADAVGTVTGAIFGTSTVTSYIESASGVAEGGRSGLTAVVTGTLFLLSIFFIPLLVAIPAIATAPTLIIVGVLMVGSIRDIEWDDPAEAIPSFLTMIMMPLSYSIADGLAAGLISFPLIKLFQGKAQDIPFAIWIIAVAFLVKFILETS